MYAEQLYQNAQKAIEKKRYIDAIKMLQKALQMEPNEPDFLHELALAYHESGDSKRAIDTFQKLISLDAYNEFAWNDFGNVYTELMDFEKALRCYEKAFSINPNDTDRKSVV